MNVNHWSVFALVLHDIFCALRECLPQVLKSVLPFVALVVAVRVGYWLRKKYYKGLRG